MMPIIASGIIAESGRIASQTSELTKRELEILKLVQRGRHNREIAQEMGIEEKTVKNHINNIYSKLGIASRVEAMAARLDAPPDR
jgi:DNA-binding NarL/FixJ family response regulator